MIKNIIFDIDGVLVDLDQCYFNFLRESYEEFKNIDYSDFSRLFPLNLEDGVFTLPEYLYMDFANSPYYCNRPLFDDTMDVFNSLKVKGINLFTLSAAGNPAKKLVWLEVQFKGIFKAFEFSPPNLPKDAALRETMEKHSMKKEETIFIDDRIFNIKAGLITGVHTVRREPEFNLPLPEELGDIPSFCSLSAFEKYVDEVNSL